MLVVEHDAETIESADWVLDFGPGAGRHGGKIVAAGPPAKLRNDPKSPTGRFLSGRDAIEVPATRRRPTGWIEVKGAKANNLRDIDARIPLGVLCAVTGVSGAGKSSLINQILHPALRNVLHDSKWRVGEHKSIAGVELIDKVIDIDQNPIGRTPRSNPATYTKAFEPIRRLFAGTQEARTYGYTQSRFSFNVRGGRCEACEGDGVREVEMHFLANVHVTCEVCKGKRYNDATLRVTWKGKNISEMLSTTVSDALELFANQPQIVAHPAHARRRRPRLPAARAAGDDAIGRRGAADQAVARAGEARRRGGRSTSSTSRPPGCTSPTSSASCRCSSGWSTPATQCWSSSTTSTSSSAPTG